MWWSFVPWFFFMLINLGLVAIVFHALLCLTDLEADQVDLFAATARINRWVLPEFVLQATLAILLLLTGHWIMFLMLLPLTVYHLYLFVNRQHLIHVTEVFRNLNFDKTRGMIKLGFYLLFLTIIFIRIFAGFIRLFNSAELDFRSAFLAI